jgi:hypothetical protein
VRKREKAKTEFPKEVGSWAELYSAAASNFAAVVVVVVVVVVLDAAVV